MSKQSEKVKQWRKTCKQRIIDAMGGKCCICNYNRCNSVLALHHLDPTQKDFSFGAIRANPKNWKSLVKELRKCVLICHNCHSEVHEGFTIIPDILPKFNEEYADYKRVIQGIEKSFNPCQFCNTMKLSHLKYCSPTCAAKSRYKVPWDTFDLETELKTKSVIQLSEEIGCSDAAIHKRLKKLGLK